MPHMDRNKQLKVIKKKQTFFFKLLTEVCGGFCLYPSNHGWQTKVIFFLFETNVPF